MEKDIVTLARSQRAYDDMPAITESLLALYEQGDYPVPVISIVKNLGFKVYDMDMEDENLSGLIAIDDMWQERFGTGKVIGVNRNDSNEHKRFAIAHELAHYLFDAPSEKEYYNTYRTDESKWDEEQNDRENRETVANYFAANLLMPSLDFRRKYNEFKKELSLNSKTEIVGKLAAYFGVPKTAVEIRFRELGIQLEIG